MAYFFKYANGGEWSSINEVLKIGQCNARYKVDA
jgi:hypothetical protein